MWLRKYFCPLLGCRYRAIWFKSSHPEISEAQAGIADTETGCVYCGKTKPNEFPINIDHIDWNNTYRTTPPKHNVYSNPDG